MKVIILDPAEDDLVSIHDYYERQRRGLGKRFLSAFQDALTYVERFPRGFAKVYKNVRLCTIERFPYGIFFTIGSKFVFRGQSDSLIQKPSSMAKTVGLGARNEGAFSFTSGAHHPAGPA